MCRMSSIPWRPLRSCAREPMPRVFPSRACEETRESRGMPCLFLNTERGFGGKPPKNRGFVGILRGQKCLRDVFHGDLPLESGLAARARCLGFLAGVAAVSDRDDAALFPAIRILERYGSAKSGRAR